MKSQYDDKCVYIYIYRQECVVFFSELPMQRSNPQGLRLCILLLMEEILHQLIGSLSHNFQDLYIPGGAGFLPSTV